MATSRETNLLRPWNPFDLGIGVLLVLFSDVPVVTAVSLFGLQLGLVALAVSPSCTQLTASGGTIASLVRSGFTPS
jgi:hypothetical protein